MTTLTVPTQSGSASEVRSPWTSTSFALQEPLYIRRRLRDPLGIPLPSLKDSRAYNNLPSIISSRAIILLLLGSITGGGAVLAFLATSAKIKMIATAAAVVSASAFLIIHNCK